MGAILFNDKAYPAGSSQASDSVYDNSTTGLPANVQGALDQTTDNISSSIELSTIAVHAHAVGSCFIWIGQLVKVTTAIAVGDTIAVGTNVANMDICSVLDEVNSNLENVGRHFNLGSVSGSKNSQTFTVDMTQYRFIIVSHWYLDQNCDISMMIPRRLFVDANSWDVYRIDDAMGYVNNTSNNGFTINTTSKMDNNWSIKVIGVK